MATDNELRTNQKDLLFKLLRLEKRNAGSTVIGLRDDIIEAKAKMIQEDVAYVEKMIDSL